jgi:hypothetical protein
MNGILDHSWGSNQAECGWPGPWLFPLIRTGAPFSSQQMGCARLTLLLCCYDRAHSVWILWAVLLLFTVNKPTRNAIACQKYGSLHQEIAYCYIETVIFLLNLCLVGLLCVLVFGDAWVLVVWSVCLGCVSDCPQHCLQPVVFLEEKLYWCVCLMNGECDRCHW